MTRQARATDKGRPEDRLTKDSMRRFSSERIKHFSKKTGTRKLAFSAEGRRDLLETVEQRCGCKSIVIASQIPVDRWPEVIGEPTTAEAVPCRIELAGESRRRRNAPPPLAGGTA